VFGLSFTNPTMLYGLFAAAIPVLIHILNRRRSVTVSFSNVALLQSLQQDRMRRVRIKQWVLLALRTLLITLLVLAFARPTVRESGFGSGLGESTGVLLLDQSLSMQYEADGKTFLAAAKGRANEALDLFEPDDLVTLISFDNRASVSESLTPDRIKLLLHGITPTFRTSDPVPAIDAARTKVRESVTVNREVFVLSDIARVGWERVREPYDGFEGATIYVVRPPVRDQENASVASVRPTGYLLSPGEQSELVAEIENFGSGRLNTLQVQAYVDDQRIGQKVIGVEPGERKRVQFRYTPDKGGAREFRVEIPADALLADNTRSTVVHIPEKLSVALIGEPDNRYYAEEALRASRGAALEVTPIEPGSAGSDAYDTFDVLVLCSVGRLTRAETNAICRRVAQGAGLMVLLGEGIDVRTYNEQILPALCPLSITGVSGRREDRNRFMSFDGSPTDHPVLEGLVGDDLRSPHFYLSYTSQLGKDTRALVTFGSGAPALVESRLDEGRVMVLMSHADLAWSDLPVSGFFAPFLNRAVRYLSSGAFGVDDVRVGRRVVRPTKTPDAREAVVQPPSGPVQTVWSQQRGDRAYWVIDEVEIPGIWELVAQERVVDRFAVQVAPEESDPTPLPDAAVSSLFPGAQVVFVDPDASLSDVVMQHRFGAELWRVFLFAALACAAVELFLMAGERRERGS
jgi:hypothetical protein